MDYRQTLIDCNILQDINTLDLNANDMQYTYSALLFVQSLPLFGVVVLQKKEHAL